ncbi:MULTISPECIES: hypothetical protein [unclassified Tolypothrix]|uniref:hypothetical protein n=1 Tax=unclassified Tolypothrix TaxID=2649714 RepID=UPI0012D71DC6|nr:MULTISPECIES: hypothetical protein [unclassified Tolypothrix]MBE9085397.1 hypothetical protein [Tolypothrix sp. LEGE 11397]UYD23865.1 hypothetical protein HGR01_20395 [Tolypothrix sp. PCC 7712]UYD33910.1 hypothetical protein HG267_34360 [Tolypothrix sp. PCC 7601]
MTRRAKRSRRHRNLDTLRTAIQCEYSTPALTDGYNLLLYPVPHPELLSSISAIEYTQSYSQTGGVLASSQ